MHNNTMSYQVVEKISVLRSVIVIEKWEPVKPTKQVECMRMTCMKHVSNTFLFLAVNAFFCLRSTDDDPCVETAAITNLNEQASKRLNKRRDLNAQ